MNHRYKITYNKKNKRVYGQMAAVTCGPFGLITDLLTQFHILFDFT